MSLNQMSIDDQIKIIVQWFVFWIIDRSFIVQWIKSLSNDSSREWSETDVIEKQDTMRSIDFSHWVFLTVCLYLRLDERDRRLIKIKLRARSIWCDCKFNARQQSSDSNHYVAFFFNNYIKHTMQKSHFWEERLTLHHKHYFNLTIQFFFF